MYLELTKEQKLRLRMQLVDELTKKQKQELVDELIESDHEDLFWNALKKYDDDIFHTIMHYNSDLFEPGKGKKEYFRWIMPTECDDPEKSSYDIIHLLKDYTKYYFTQDGLDEIKKVIDKVKKQ